MLNLYITSANKKDGKTFVSAGISATMQSLGYQTSVYKPIQTAGIEINGFMQSPDLTFIKTVDPYIETAFSYLFKADTEPLIAAEEENKYIDIDLINSEYLRISRASDCTIIDGDSGLLSPVAPSIQNIHLIKKFQTPVLMVVSPQEDVINTTLLALNLLEEQGIDTRGVIINNIKEGCSKKALTSITRVIEEYSGANILGLLPYLGENFAPEELITSILNGMDIESVFNIQIAKLDLG